MNTAVLEDLSFTTGYETRAVVADGELIRSLVLELYGEELREKFEEAIDKMEGEGGGEDGKDEL